MKLLIVLIFFSSVCLAQTKRVALTPMGSDMTTNIRTVVTDPDAKVIELERSGNRDILVNGTVDFKGKVLKINPGTTIVGNYKFKNAIINASDEDYIFATTGTFENVKSVNGSVSVKWFGANGEDQVDDYAACQKAIDVAIASGSIGIVKFPYGNYIVSKGLNIRRSDGAGLPSKFVSLTVSGEVAAFDTGPIGAATTVTTTDPNSFVFNIQRGKGCIIEYIYFQGQNRLNLSPEKVIDEKTNWNVNGTSNRGLSPHCGIAIDGLGKSDVKKVDRYPGFVDLYTETSNGGSTDITIRNCAFRYFTVGVAVSPNGTTQNAEIVKIKDCWIDYCRVCVSTGNSQTRTVLVENLKSWGNVEVVIDSERYGGGGALPEIHGANFAGSIKYLCRASAVGIPVAVLTDVYAETLYAIGGNLRPTGSTLQMNLVNCQLNFMGGEQSTSTPTVIVRAGQLNITGGYWTYYSHNTFQPLPIDCPITTVVGASLYGILWDINGSPVFNQNVKIHSLYNSPLNNNGITNFAGIEDGRLVSAEGSYVYAPSQKRTYTEGPLKTIAGIDANISIIDKDHARFNVGADNKSSVMGGEFVMIQGYGGRSITDNSTNATGYYFVLGIIQSVDPATGNVIVKNIPHNLDLSVGRFRFYIFTYLSVYKTHIGDIQQGSTVIKNIVGEGNSVSQRLEVGDIISHPAFPQYPATRIISVNQGQVTVNQKATYSEASAALTATNYTGETKSNIAKVLANDTKVAWKKGDKIINDFSDPKDNSITEWTCMKSGIVNSNNPPLFIPK